MDGKVTTMSIRVVEIDGEGMAAPMRRYECLFPVDLQGAVHMRTKGTTGRKMGVGRANMARLGDCPCGQGLDST